jgi:hypothetical protein
MINILQPKIASSITLMQYWLEIREKGEQQPLEREDNLDNKRMKIITTRMNLHKMNVMSGAEIVS